FTSSGSVRRCLNSPSNNNDPFGAAGIRLAVLQPEQASMSSDKNSDAIAVSMEHVEKWYGSFHALKDVNLQVATGERIVVCGPSGSGKSTLIRCINRLEPYDGGKIFVNDTLVDGPSATLSVRREVGMVFQQFNLFPHLTVLE